MHVAAYHSALRGVDVSARPRERVISSNGVTFVHDLLSGPLPRDYEACDVLYADLPWRAGLAEFEERAGVALPRNYAIFMAGVSRIIRSTSQLAILVTGCHATKLLPWPTQLLDSTLNGAPCRLFIYNGELERTKFSNTVDLVHWLAERYHCIGDFCCGYGRAGRIFAEHGKRFVMSDYNAECVGYIGDTL